MIKRSHEMISIDKSLNIITGTAEKAGNNNKDSSDSDSDDSLELANSNRSDNDEIDDNVPKNKHGKPSKKIKFSKERYELLHKVFDILDVSKNDMIIDIDEFESNKIKQQKILAMIDDIKKYYSYGLWTYFVKNKLGFPCLSLVKSLLKDHDYKLVKIDDKSGDDIVFGKMQIVYSGPKKAPVKTKPTKKEKYPNERKLVLNKLFKILGVSEKNMTFSFDDLEGDKLRQQQIIALSDEIKKYFNYGAWLYYCNPDIKKPYMTLTKSLLKDMGYSTELLCVTNKTKKKSTRHILIVKNEK